jgi:hypothetical protein
MKTYFEIIENKNYRQLSDTQKEALQNRQTELALLWQDTKDEIKQREIFDELHASLKGFIKSKARKESERSYSVEQEDFEGIIYLTLAETLITFDRTLDKPFQPVFIYNIRNQISMMYRDKKKDVHETTFHDKNRLDSIAPDDDTLTMADTIECEHAFESNVEHNVLVDQIVNDVFNGDEKKRTIIHMSIQDFKRNEIISAVNKEGKSTDSVARLVNRTVNQFKASYLKLT